MIASVPFHVTIGYDSNNGTLPVVAVAGEVDASSVPELGAVILGVVRAVSVTDTGTASRRYVTVDLCAVTFMDAAGLRLLAETTDTARHRGVQLTFREPSRAVSHLLARIGSARRAAETHLDTTPEKGLVAVVCGDRVGRHGRGSVG